MDAVLNKFKEFKKIIYFCVCGFFVFLLLCDFILNVDNKVFSTARFSPPDCTGF